MFFDTHAHYDDARFDCDRETLLASLPEHGVGLVVNPGCDVESSRKALEYAKRFSHIYAAVGIHPSNVDTDWQTALEQIEALAHTQERICAIGEIGLDYYWERNEQGRAKQQVVFRRQMQMAERLGLPVIVHDRDAHADCLAVTKEFPSVRGVYHCYAGSVEMARELIACGYYLSFTGVATFRNARKAAEVIAQIPLEHLLIETDAPYMAPEPFRGRRNDSRYVYRVAEAIAEIKGIAVSQVEQMTEENGKSLFGLS